MKNTNKGIMYHTHERFILIHIYKSLLKIKQN